MQAYKILVSIVALGLPLTLSAQSDESNSSPSANPSSAPGSSTATPDATNDAGKSPQDELAAKQQELAEVTREISSLQKQAEDNEAVQSAKQDYYDTLRAEMVRVAPDLKTDIERQAELVTEINQASEAGTKAAAEDGEKDSATQQEALLSEYRTLYAKIAPVEKKVQTVPAVQEARSGYYTTLIAEMERIDPNTKTLLDRHRQLLTRVRALSGSAGNGSTSG